MTVAKLSAVNPTPHVSSNPGTKLACSFLSQNSGAKNTPHTDFQWNDTQCKIIKDYYAECQVYLLLCWMSFMPSLWCWMYLCWVSWHQDRIKMKPDTLAYLRGLFCHVVSIEGERKALTNLHFLNPKHIMPIIVVTDTHVSLPRNPSGPVL